MFGTKRDEWRGKKSRGKEEMLHPHPNIGLKTTKKQDDTRNQKY